jgi:hypothetical protein
MAGEPLLYVASEDIDADLRKAESLGGTTVVPKTRTQSMRRVPLSAAVRPACPRHTVSGITSLVTGAAAHPLE